MNTSETYAPQDINYYHDVVHGRETVLTPNTDYLINTDAPLVAEDGYNVTAVIDCYSNETSKSSWQKEGIEPDQFLLIDLRNAPTYGPYKDKEFQDLGFANDIEYLIVGKNFDANAATGFKGVRKGENIVIGRDQDSSTRFDISDTTSRNHFSVNLDDEGRLTITDLNSSNGTRLKTNQTPIMNGLAPNKRYVNTGEEQNSSATPIVEEQAVKPKTSAEIWEENRNQEYSRMTDQVRSMFDSIEDSYKNELPISIAISVLNEVSNLRTQGLTDKQLRMHMMKQWHPDVHPDATSTQKEIALSVTKMLGMVI